MTPEERNSFKILVRAYFDCVQDRIDLDGMLGVKKNGELKKNIPERDNVLLIPLVDYRDGREELGKELLKQITEGISKEPLWEHFFKHVKGVGPSIAAVILCEFDIERAVTVSNMWSFAGLAPGKDKKVKGKKCTYNQFLRSKLCGVLGSSFLKSKSQPYSMFYYNEKTRLENSDNMVKEYPRKADHKKGEDPKERMVKWRDAYPDHRHKAATRKMIKEFLKHLYIAWRELEGLPVREPYSEEYLGKIHKAA